MRETAKHDDIEDVLSSIRRLVSDSAGVDRSPENDDGRTADRLVLTPALRVAEADGTLTPVETSSDSLAGELDDLADARAEDELGEALPIVADETQPERPIADLEDEIDDGGDAYVETTEDLTNSLRSALTRDLPFGLSSFTGGMTNSDAFPDNRDVVLLRSERDLDDQGATDDADESEADVEMDAGSDAEADAEPEANMEAEVTAEAETEDVAESETEAVAPVFEEVEPFAEPALEADDPAADEATEDGGWPASDVDVDGPSLEEPETWYIGDEAEAEFEAEAELETEDEQPSSVDAEAPIDAPETDTTDGAFADALASELEPAIAERAPVAWIVPGTPQEPETVVVATEEEDATEEPEADEAAEDAFTAEDVTEEVVAELAVDEDTSVDEPLADALAAEDHAEIDSGYEDSAEAPAAGAEIQAEETVEELEASADAEDDAEADAFVVPAVLATPEADQHFEPEHGDTDWSEVDTAQPALDIAAVRQARGEEITPDPDAVPQAMPIFARSRRRAMTSLDDLITPEHDTVADAVSQAMADGALDRAEGGMPEEVDAEASAATLLGEEQVPVPDDLGMIDEEALRDLIAQVVREELQGALGQRITRNVRKMVRREIRLALAAEEFE